MAVICRRHNLLFIMAPRTGCTAVAEVLRAELGGEDIPSARDQAASHRIPPKHATLRQLLQVGSISRQERASLFVFSTVRNPFDSIVSLYLKQAGPYQELLADDNSWVHRSQRLRHEVSSARELSFEDWLSANYPASLRQRIGRTLRNRRGGTNKWLEGVDFVMRYERLEEDFDEALRRAGVGRRLIVPRVNVTPGREPDYRVYYTERARRIVEVRYKAELTQFGYSF